MTEDPIEIWRSTARRNVGDDYARRFAARFDELAASGEDVHGEAAFVASLVPPGGRVLDAGCGTGRVAARLHELGYAVAGVDADEAMVDVARERFPDLPWHVGDLADLHLNRDFDLVVMAGNVVPFLPVELLPAVASRLAAHLAVGGFVVAGFGLDVEHLPPGGPSVPLEAYDESCAAAGLVLTERYGGWDRSPFEGSGTGYAVSVHIREG